MNTGELRIRTPEGISFSYQLAGPVTRCLAWALDLLVSIVLIMLGSLGPLFFGWINSDLALAFFWVMIFVVPTGYGILLEWKWRGQTVGKRVLRLRVMDADGLRLQFHQVLMRNLVRFVDLLPACYLIGGVACLLSRKGQRLGDLAAGTIVVHHRIPTEPDLEQLLGRRYNSLRDHPHLMARLRQRTSPAEAGVVLQALIRRDEFAADERVHLFHELSAHFRQRVSFPIEIIEPMPDEQFIRNVVDVLFRIRPSDDAVSRASFAA
ncbi:MAG: RDD family protein [Chthoniobacteraceae bacterium]